MTTATYISIHQFSSVGAVEEMPIPKDWITQPLCGHLIGVVDREIASRSLVANIEKDVGYEALWMIICQPGQKSRPPTGETISFLCRLWR